MVIWSYLLFGSAAGAASLEDVLAPVAQIPAAATAGDSGAGSANVDPALREPPAPRPLVHPGMDQLDVLAELERQLTDRLQPAGRLRLLPLVPLPEMPANAVAPVVELVEAPSRLVSSSLLLRFRYTDGDRQLGLHAVTFRVQVLAEVWVPAERLTPGDVLVAEDLVTREVDLVREPRAVPADRSFLGRYEIARAASPDRPLTWNDVAPRALVRKGQLVEVVGSQGLLSISMKGQATRSGALGEIVVIRNLDSKREFSAEVIDENKVRVHF